LCGILFGTPPAAQLASLEPLAALGLNPQMSSRSSLRSLLMGAQLAMAVIVLAAAALFYQSFRETKWIDPGFRTEGVLLAAYDLSGRIEATAGPDETARNDAARNFASRLVARLREAPAVEAAAISLSVPLDIHGWDDDRFASKAQRALTGNWMKRCRTSSRPVTLRRSGFRFFRARTLCRWKIVQRPVT